MNEKRKIHVTPFFESAFAPKTVFAMVQGESIPRAFEAPDHLKGLIQLADSLDRLIYDPSTEQLSINLSDIELTNDIDSLLPEHKRTGKAPGPALSGQLGSDVKRTVSATSPFGAKSGGGTDTGIDEDPDTQRFESSEKVEARRAKRKTRAAKPSKATRPDFG